MWRMMDLAAKQRVSKGSARWTCLEMEVRVGGRERERGWGMKWIEGGGCPVVKGDEGVCWCGRVRWEDAWKGRGFQRRRGRDWRGRLLLTIKEMKWTNLEERDTFVR